MRRLICLTLYIAMILAGIVLLVAFLTHGGKNVVFISGGFLVIFGGYLLWTDFLSSNNNNEPS